MSNKYFKTRTWTALLVALFVLFAAAGATAETWHVTDDFSTITDALAAASPGDTIEVSSTYDFAGEKFPILVQKNDITLTGLGAGPVIDKDIRSHAAFSVIAKRVYNAQEKEYEKDRISGVTIENFTVKGKADIGFLIKHADNITLQDNTVDASADGDSVLEGIRLIDATGSMIAENMVMGVEDIGIFLQKSTDNTLSENSVDSSGLGLFVYKSEDNEVMGDEYESNSHGGFVLNDSIRNKLSELIVYDNGGWGARFVHADENMLEQSEVYENLGGVELLASDENTVDANLVYNNGKAGDGNDDAQIVVTKGDKAEFGSDILDEYNSLGDLSEFVEEKEQVKSKLNAMEWWLDDLNMEMAHIKQRLATAIGMHEQGDPKDYIDTYLDEIVAEKLAIEEGKIRKVVDTSQLVDEDGHPVKFIDGSGMGDLGKNFTLEQSTFSHRNKLDEYTDNGGSYSSDYDGEDFGLNYYSGSSGFDESDVKIDLVEVIDSSSSMSQTQFNMEINGIRNAIDNVLRPLVERGAEIYVGFVNFSTSANIIKDVGPGDPASNLIKLEEKKTNDTVDERLDSINQLGGMTDVEEALQKAETVLSSGSSARQNIVDFSSDGIPTIDTNPSSPPDPVTSATQKATFMKNAGTEIWPIGLTISPNSTGGLFMKTIAGPDPAEASFADSFSDYNQVVEEKTEKLVEPEDEYSWSKMDLLHIILDATKNEVWNDWDVDDFGIDDPRIDGNDTALDSLKEKVEFWYDKGLITDKDFDGGPHDGLKGKLDSILGYLAQIRERMFVDNSTNTNASQLQDLPDPPNMEYSLAEKLQIIDAYIEEYMNTGDKQHLLDAKSWVEDFIKEKEELYGIIEDIRKKLCLVDVELVPFPEVNTDLLGKKEKPFSEITSGAGDQSSHEISEMKWRVKEGLNSDPAAQAVRQAVKNSATWDNPDIIYSNTLGAVHSENNTVSSNVLYTELENPASKNIGIVIESPRNRFVNNLITNEQVKPIFEETTYEESGRMDVGIVLLANENELLHNAIEWVNKGIRRGGGWEREDYQLEYFFNKMAAAGYWPGPGYGGLSETYGEGYSCGPFTDFDSRVIDWVPVLELKKESVSVGYSEDQRVFRNKIFLNFFDHNGVDIDVLDAESNDIKENLFYKSGGSAIVLKNDSFAIRVNENDFVHTSLSATGDHTLNASDNYGEGVTVFGNVTPPSADSPFCMANFGNEDKFEDYGIGEYFNDGILPPNLSKLYMVGEEGVVLPPEKPRTCEDIFGDGEEEPPAEETATTTFSPGAGAGFMMVSYPLEAPDPTVDAIFDEFTGQTLWNFWSNENPSAYVTRNGTGTISHNRGYWVYLNGDTEVTVEGSAVSGPANFTFPVPGWYMISTPFASDWASQSSTGLEGNGAGYTRLVYFNDEAGQYVNRYSNDSFGISPWKGYWVKAVDAGATLTLPQVSVPSVPSGASSSYSLPEGVDVDALDMPPAPPFAQQLDLDSLEVTAASVSDGVTFSVKGEEAAFASGLEVKVFSASGGEVFSAQSAGSSLTWNAQGVSNGVYLYTATAYVNGKTVSTDIDKLLLVK